MSNAVNWFEIPTTNLDRATKFYESVLGASLKREGSGPTPMAIFPYEDSSVSGALIQDARRKPSPEGTLVYLNAGKQLDACLQRVDKAGGEVVTPKMDIGEHGYIAVFRDTEGNTVALHQER